LDKTFGSDGTGIVKDIVGMARGVALTNDNRIVVVGTTVNSGTFLVARYTADGKRDSTFNKGRVLSHTWDAGQQYATDVAIQKGDQKIVVAGVVRSAPTFGEADYDMGVLRLNADGTTDKGFGDDGERLIDQNQDEMANAVTIDYAGTKANNPDYGKIVVV